MLENEKDEDVNERLQKGLLVEIYLHRKVFRSTDFQCQLLDLRSTSTSIYWRNELEVAINDREKLSVEKREIYSHLKNMS